MVALSTTNSKAIGQFEAQWSWSWKAKLVGLVQRLCNYSQPLLACFIIIFPLLVYNFTIMCCSASNILAYTMSCGDYQEDAALM
jgi:hypothetical protein